MLPMRRKIEHIIEHECKVKSFVKGTFDEKRILVDLDKICSKMCEKIVSINKRLKNFKTKKNE